MKLLALAIAITAERFTTKLDRGGQPYILHCLTVMNNTEGDECVKCAAVMHDLIEDTPTTANELSGLGFSDKTIGLLNLLTRNPETDYMDYIRAIGMSSEASAIKRADLEHNSQITRLKGINKKDVDRMIKYHQAYLYLKGI